MEVPLEEIPRLSASLLHLNKKTQLDTCLITSSNQSKITFYTYWIHYYNAAIAHAQHLPFFQNAPLTSQYHHYKYQ